MVKTHPDKRGGKFSFGRIKINSVEQKVSQTNPVLAEDHPLREIVFTNAKPRKCPDLKINGRFTEVKMPIGDIQARKISRNIKVGHAQADDIILKLQSNIAIRALREIVKGRFITHHSLSNVEFKMGECIIISNVQTSYKKSSSLEGCPVKCPVGLSNTKIRNLFTGARPSKRFFFIRLYSLLKPRLHI